MSALTSTEPAFLPLIKEGISLSIPSILLQLSLLLPYTFSSIHLGHATPPSNTPFDYIHTPDNPSPSTLSLSSFSLSNLLGNLTSLLLIVGILSSNDTLNQQYVGSNSPRARGMVGVLAIRAFVVSIAILIPLVATWHVPFDDVDNPGITLMPHLLSKMGSDPALLPQVSTFLRYYTMSVPALLLFNILQRFLSCQNVVFPLVLISSISTFIVHPLMLHFAVDVTTIFVDCDYLDSSCVAEGVHRSMEMTAISHTVTNWSCLLLMVLYLLVFKSSYDKSTWTGINADSLTRALLDFDALKKYVALSIAGVLCLSEWLFWEYIAFLISSIGVSDLSIHAVGYTLVPLMYMIPLGCSIALNIVVGKQLTIGRDRVNVAKKVAKYGLMASLLITVSYGSLIYAFRRTIITTFTDDPTVYAGAMKIWPSVCIFIMFDGCFVSSSF
jgi:Na+-driven multidrug efflux pump